MGMRPSVPLSMLLVACDAARASRPTHEQAPAAVTVTVAAPVLSTPAPAPPVARAPSKPALVDGCPPEMGRVEKACVDRWEAHLVVESSGSKHPHFERPQSDLKYAARSAPGVFPQGYINRLEARAACEASGKRLCKLTEWYRACTGSKKQTYGYGASYERGRCNVAKPHLLGKLFGNNPRNWSYDGHFNSPRLNQEPGGLALTGAHEGCTNDYGVSDMVGNLHEWVADHVDRSLVTKIPLRDDIRDKIPIHYGKGIFMGGFYSTLSEHGRGCTFLTPGHEPKYRDYSTGFRCCRDASDIHGD
jgi:formylglycine-generating enzyme